MKKKLLLQDLAELLVANEEIGKKEADTFVRAFFDIIEQGLLEEKFVKIKGLGTFKLVAVSERESVNVNTGERIQISGHTKVTFTPDTSMKELVNRPFAHFEAVDLNDDTDVAELEELEELDATTALYEEGEDEPEDSLNSNETEDFTEQASANLNDAEDETGKTQQKMLEEGVETKGVESVCTEKNYDTADTTNKSHTSESIAAEEQTENTDKANTLSLAEGTSEHQTDEPHDAADATSCNALQEESEALGIQTESAIDTFQTTDENESSEEQLQPTDTEETGISEKEEEEDVVAGEPTPINPKTVDNTTTSVAPDAEQTEDAIRATTTINFATENEILDAPANLAEDNHQTFEQDSDAQPLTDNTDDSDEDIVVTAPQHLTPHGDSSHTTPLTNGTIKYEYTEVPMPRKRNWWKVGLISLCTLLIMLGCYFAGYFRLLCPPCQFPILEGVFIPADRPHLHDNSNGEGNKRGQSTASATDTNRHHNPTLATTPSTSHSKATDPKSENTATKTSSENLNSKDADSALSQQQTDNSKKKPAKHVVRPGDTLLNISRKYYGSEAYVKAIMNLNHLKDSNNIAVGLVLQLP